MRVRLVRDVPNDLVVGGVKDVVEGQGRFDDPQVWPEVPANRRVFFHDQVPDFIRHLV